MVTVYENIILGFLALGGALLAIILIVILALYIYAALALMAIAKKTNTPKAWFAFIPIANIYLMTQIIGISGWWTAAVVLAFVPILGSLVIIAGTIYLWWKIAEKLGKPGWWGILMLIPIVNLVLMGIMAWGE